MSKPSVVSVCLRSFAAALLASVGVAAWAAASRAVATGCTLSWSQARSHDQALGSAAAVSISVGSQLAAGQRPGLPAAVKRVIQQALAADPRPDETRGLRSMQWHGRNASISGPQHRGRTPARRRRWLAQARRAGAGVLPGEQAGCSAGPGAHTRAVQETGRCSGADGSTVISTPSGALWWAKPAAVKQRKGGETVRRRNRSSDCAATTPASSLLRGGQAAYLVSASTRRSMSSSTLPVLGRSRAASWSLSSALVWPS